MPTIRLRALLPVLVSLAALAACDDDPVGLDPIVDNDGRTYQGTYAIDAVHTEGGIYDPAQHAFFVGSLASGGVYRVDGETGETEAFFEPDEAGSWWTLGMDIDPMNDRLYVCAMDDRRELEEEHDYAGWLWGFDLITGDRVVREPLSIGSNGTCTDVAVAADGTVYVNDRQHPRLYVYDEGRLQLLVEDDELSGAIVGQNALLVLPDQSALLSLVYLPSRLVRIDLESLTITEVDIAGDFSDLVPALSGADGMTFTDGGALLVAFTSQVNRLATNDNWFSAASITVDVDGGGLTDVVHTPLGDYLLNGQAVDFALGNDPEPATLVRFGGF